MRIISSAFFLGVTLLAGSAAMAAGKAQPYAIRGEAAVPLSAGPATTAHFGCELRLWASTRLPCYGPEAIRKAYGLASVIASGYDGTGETIVIIDAYGSPTIEADLAAFDALFGVPAPRSFRQIRMPGTLPFDYTDNNQVGWAEETSLDVEWAHAMAPGANIVLMVAASNNDPDLLAAQNYAINHEVGHVISESYGESELALQQDGAEGVKILADDERSYRRARDEQISVFVSAGDSGAESYDINGVNQLVPVAQYPASSPNVTSVGGTNLFFGTATNADPNGSYQGEVVWNDGHGAGGGGISRAFGLPRYQYGLGSTRLAQLGGHRGYPDVAYNAGVRGGVIAYLGFLDTAFGGPGYNGFYIFGGTSAGAPQWAGVAALANHVARRPIGFVNNSLYRSGRSGALSFLVHDVTVGDNSFDGVTGFAATSGWDLATGWGTPSSGLVYSLAATPDDSPTSD